MRLRKSFNLALNILLHSRLRSWLTITGIVIGVAAVVAIISIGEGAQLNIQQRLSGLGADIITVSPGGGRATGGFGGGGVEYRVRGGGGGGFGESSFTSTAQNLTIKDLQVIRTAEGVSVATGTISGRATMYYLAESSSVSVEGVDPVTWNAISNLALDSGRLLNQGDSNAILVGSSIAKSTFKQPLAVNRDITINGKSFKIVGILQQSGGLGGGNDNRILMPLSIARDTIEGAGRNEFDSITVKASSADMVNQVTADIDAKLMISRHLTTRTKDYRISSSQSTQQTISSTLQTFTVFLGAIAAVSLLVGAVGIANTLFTSVLEKTKEIGIMKAIGAKNRDIMIIFLLNSGLVGLVGGVLGVSLGTAISSLLPNLGIRLMGAGGSLTTSVSPSLIILSLALSLAIGMIAGAIPAYRASKLKPVDALRYE